MSRHGSGRRRRAAPGEDATPIGAETGDGRPQGGPDVPGATAYPATPGASGGGEGVADDAARGTRSGGDPAEAEPGPRGLKPSPPPLEGDIVKLVGVGTIVWTALFLIAWFVRDDLSDDGRGWWPWCALAGAGLGLLGMWYCRRLRAAAEDG